VSGEGPPSAVELFDAASKLPRESRAKFLDQRCRGDAALKSEVESLLTHLEAAEGFLDKSLFGGRIVDPKTPTPTSAVGDLVGAMAGYLPAGTVVGRYRIERVLGEGGMGTVYLAQQETPRRKVALKLMRPGAASAPAIRRFEREAEVLGRLQHPGIAQIFEAGTAELAGGLRQPFLAMELVEGRTLTEYARDQGLSARQRLALVARICDAVDHAHRRGLVHRDLKPANILVRQVTEVALGEGERLGVGGPGDSLGQPKILDFGVARLMDADPVVTTLATTAGQLIGTLAYMSPEQVVGDPGGVDARSDVYALGVILYELLTGQLPHNVRDKMVLEAARMIREDEPTRLTNINRVFRGDVETIVLKAMEKDRSRRYQSAAAMAEDIRRYLSGEPIVAKQDSALYVLQKRLKRYRWAVAASAAFLVLMLGIAAWSSWQAAQFRSLAKSEAAAKLAAQENGREAREMLRKSNLERGRLLGVSGDLPAAEDLLWGAMAQKPGASDVYWALWELYNRYPCVRAMGGHTGAIWVAAFTPDSKMLITAGADGVLAARDMPSGRIRWRKQAHKDRISRAVFTPDGESIASAGLDSVVKVWRVSDGSPVGEEFIGHSLSVSMIDFSPDGARMITSGEDSTVRLWDFAGRREIRRFVPTGEKMWSVRLLRDGKTAIVGDHVGNLQAWDTERLEPLWKTRPHTMNVLSMALHPNGKILATGSSDGTVCLVDVADGRIVKRVSTRARTPRGLDYNQDGTLLAVTCTWACVVMDASTLEVVPPALPELSGGWSASFSPDGGLLATTAWPSSVRLWEMSPEPARHVIERHATGVSGMAAGAGVFFSAASNGEVTKFETPGMSRMWKGEAGRGLRWLALSHDGAMLATAHGDGLIRLVDASSGSVIGELKGHTGQVNTAVFLSDGRLVSGGMDWRIRIWDTATQRELATLKTPEEVLGLATSPDGKWLVASPRKQFLMAWSLPELEDRPRHIATRTVVWNPTFAPDSRQLAAGGFGGNVELLDLMGGSERASLISHRRLVPRTAISPDGDWLVSVSNDRLIKIWSLEDGAELATLQGCGSEATSAHWIPGTSKFAVGYRTGEVEVWDIAWGDRHIAGNASFFAGLMARDESRLEGSAALYEWATKRFGLEKVGDRETTDAAGIRELD
jgi:WD40 repeat protein